MKLTKYILLCFFLFEIHCKNIPFLNNAVLIPIRPVSIGIILTNFTCDQCICLTLQNSSILALNCYTNLTCQFFLSYPRTYKIQSLNNSRLYFLQNIFPNSSNSCCMSNTTLLLSKLQNATNTMISITVTTPRCLLIDNNGSLVTVEQTSSTPSYMDRLDPKTLTLQEHIPINALVSNIGYYQYKYYIGINSNYTISVFNHGVTNNSLNYITNINSLSSTMNGVRDMIFLNDGQTMIVASADNNRIYFYSLINNTNYTMTTYMSVNYQTPHGLYRVNDSFFYVAAWTGNSIYGYNYNKATSNWTQTLFVSGGNTNSNYGSHIMIDDCNRRWFTSYGYGIKIYDENGINLANWNLGSGYFDTLLLDNYIVLLSNTANSKIMRIDPQIVCDAN
jgi:hypothetical protein